MPDIADQIDAAIGAAPPDAPGLDATLALGRRALLRRRLAYGAGAAATVVVIGGTAWAVSPGNDAPSRSDGPGFVGQTTATTAEAPSTPPDPPRQIKWVGKQAAALDEAGRLQVKPGWHVVEDVSGPGMTGAEIANGDRRQWFLFGEGMTIASLHAPQPGYDSFQDWVDVNAPLLESDDPGGQGDGSEWPGVERDDLVRFSQPEVSLPEPGTLVPVHDTEILEQRPGADVGDSFAAPDDVTGVALVTSEGSRVFVLARLVDGGPAQYIAVSASADMDTIEEFLAFARERYAEGGGGLL